MNPGEKPSRSPSRRVGLLVLFETLLCLRAASSLRLRFHRSIDPLDRRTRPLIAVNKRSRLDLASPRAVSV